jgi:uncharacterized OB-fold protein
MATQIPLVNYLALEPSPHLVAQECTCCAARFFGRRNACAKCGRTEFRAAELPSEGVVDAFTIVWTAAPNVKVPFVAAYINVAGTHVSANVINCPPDPEHVRTGMKVRLATYSLGADSDGVEGVGFGYEPADPEGIS